MENKVVLGLALIFMGTKMVFAEQSPKTFFENTEKSKRALISRDNRDG